MSIISEASYLINSLINFENENIHETKNNNHCILESAARNNTSLFKTGTVLASKIIGAYKDFAQLYHFPEKKYYVVLGGYIGSCDGCMEPSTIEHVKNIIYKAYVINDYEKAQSYYDSFKRGYY